MSRASADHQHQSRTLLLATDRANSVYAEISKFGLNPITYCAYGERSAQQEFATHLGFNGELLESSIGWYLLGNGYRAYNPRLMRFHSPDSWSPFGRGGLNAYMYGKGDPANFSDPTGHVNLFKWLGLSRRSRSSSTSSLSPLISNSAHTPLAATPPPAGTGAMKQGPTSMPRYENIPPISEGKHTIVSTYKPIAPRLGSEAPPPIPSRQKPRFNDAGGQVGVISPNWRDGEPYRYRKIWNSKPFEFPLAPIPAARNASGGGTFYYYVRYDDAGNPTQSSTLMAHIRDTTAHSKKQWLAV